MSNQRPGKWKPAGLSDGSLTGGPMRQLEFFKGCREVLERYGHEDAAFYFEQCESWIREGKDLYNSKPSKVLGV